MIEAWYDGAVEPINPGGHGSFGIVIKRDGKKIFEHSDYIGIGPEISSNVAEYRGLIEILSHLINQNLINEEILIRGDNKMSILQMAGLWKAKKGFYLEHYKKAHQLAQAFKNISFEWIPRELNQEADDLSRKPLEGKNMSFRLHQQIKVA
jgi:ribonuclease HI